MQNMQDMEGLGQGLRQDVGGDLAPGSRRSALRLLGRGLPLAGVVALTAFNATQFPPLFDSVSYYLDSFARGTPLYSRELYFNLTSVFISLMTLMIAGIPAALYERIRGLKASTPFSLTIWLVAIVLLSLPTLMGVLGGDELGADGWS